MAVSDRESALLTLVCRGGSNAEIARALHLSTATVRGYLTALYTRFAVASRTELATRAIFYGLVDAGVWPPVATSLRCVPMTVVTLRPPPSAGDRIEPGGRARCG